MPISDRDLNESDIDSFHLELADAELNSTLGRFFQNHSGSYLNKWTHYLDVYSELFDHFRDTDVRILEIGVSNGGSLELWRKYFGPKATIFGIDVNPKCQPLGGTSGEVRIGSQADVRFLNSVVEEMGGVDIVIDDGSHLASDQVASFNHLFYELSDGGIYVVEDLHTSYWRNYGGGFRRDGTMIETIKQIIDDIHSPYSREPMRFLRGTDPDVVSLSIFDSLVVIRKKKWSRPSHIDVGTKRL